MQSYAVCHSTGNVCSGYLWRLSLIQSLQPRDYKAIDAMLGCLKWCSCYALACETSYFLTLQLYHEFKIYDRCNYFRELPTIFELLWKSYPQWSWSGPPLQQQCFNKSIIVFSTWNSSCPFELTEVWKPLPRITCDDVGKQGIFPSISYHRVWRKETPNCSPLSKRSDVSSCMSNLNNLLLSP